jgi:ABC-2 type transport system permease protein
MTSTNSPKKPAHGASKKLSARAAAWIGILTVLVLVTAAALVSQLYLHGRLDLTRTREFTLSRASIKTLKNLPDIVTVRVVMSRNLPTQFQQIRTQAVDLLREFEARSDGKFVLVFEDPGEDPAKRQAAATLGIQEVQLQEQTRDGMQVKKGFFGLALLYGDKKEVFPVVQNLETFEYDLLVRLMKLTGKMKTIGVVEGSDGNKMTFALPGEQDAPPQGFERLFPTLKGNMEQLYRLSPQFLAWMPVSKDVDLLLVAAPSRLSEVEKFRIDQFILSGRPVVFLTPGMEVSLATGITANPVVNLYEDLLGHYGLNVRKNMLLEAQQWEMVRFGNAMFPAPYPYWIVPTYNTLNAENPITAGLQSLSFPWTSSIDIDSSAQPGAKVETLVSTTDLAWEESGNLYLYPREINEYLPENQKTFPLAVLQTGTLTSRYASGAPMGVTEPEATGLLKKSKADARVLLVSNALFVSDFYISYTKAGGNYHFLLNAFDYLALDPDLIRVRGRQIEESPLDEAVVTRAKTPMVLANLAIAPLLLIVLGIVAGVRRRKKETA